jgi:uncharacterized protein (DUF1501 family)
MRALSIGSTLPRLLVGVKQAGTAIAAGGVTIPGGARLGPSIAALDAPGPDRTGLAARVASSGADLLKVQHIMVDMLGRSAVSGAVAGGALAGGALAGGALATQLDVVAKLIKAGSPTRVYHVSMGGFDNHAQEKDLHARLMSQLDSAVAGFFQAIKGDANGGGVVLMTYSEFGRRVAQNASGGTDHGTAAPLFVAGPAVKGGRFYGEQPSLATLDQGDLRFTTDFRTLYATMLAKVVGVDPKVAVDGQFPPLGLL